MSHTVHCCCFSYLCLNIQYVLVTEIYVVHTHIHIHTHTITHTLWNLYKKSKCAMNLFYSFVYQKLPSFCISCMSLLSLAFCHESAWFYFSIFFSFGKMFSHVVNRFEFGIFFQSQVRFPAESSVES